MATISLASATDFKTDCPGPFPACEMTIVSEGLRRTSKTDCRRPGPASGVHFG